MRSEDSEITAVKLPKSSSSSAGSFMCPHVDLSSRCSEFLPESNRRPRDRQSRALTN